jgi:hypothetical protein
VLDSVRDGWGIVLLLVALPLSCGCRGEEPKQAESPQPGAKPVVAPGWDSEVPVSVDFVDTPLDVALADLSRQCGARIFLDPPLEKVLREQGEIPLVTLKLRAVPVGPALKLVIAVAFDYGGHDFWEDEEGVRVGSPDAYFLREEPEPSDER